MFIYLIITVLFIVRMILLFIFDVIIFVISIQFIDNTNEICERESAKKHRSWEKGQEKVQG